MILFVLGVEVNTKAKARVGFFVARSWGRSGGRGSAYKERERERLNKKKSP